MRKPLLVLSVPGRVFVALHPLSPAALSSRVEAFAPKPQKDLP